MDIWNITHRNRHVDRYVASLPAAVRAAVDGVRQAEADVAQVRVPAAVGGVQRLGRRDVVAHVARHEVAAARHELARLARRAGLEVVGGRLVRGLDDRDLREGRVGAADVVAALAVALPLVGPAGLEGLEPRRRRHGQRRARDLQARLRGPKPDHRQLARILLPPCDRGRADRGRAEQ